MRTIKFRAWDSEEKKMMQVESIDWQNDLCCVNEGDNTITDNIDMFELLEFTGLKDAKGNDIYEGDILGRTTIPDRYVCFENGSFITNKPHIPNYKPIILIDGFDVVVGNIYENPEFLSIPTAVL